MPLVLSCVLGVMVACVLLAVTGACYRSWAKKKLEEHIRSTPTNAATGIVVGAEPIEIDRKRQRACLLLHGFISSPADFGGLPAALDRAGWDVYAPLLPGHGTRPDALTAVDAEQIYEFVVREYERLRGRYRTLGVVGFSLGGTVATRLVTSVRPQRVVLVSPFYGIRYRPYYVLPVHWWYKVLTPFLKYVVRPESFIRVNRREALTDIVSYPVFPGVAMDSLLELRGLAVEAQNLEQWTQPVLFLVSPNDQAASPAAVRKVFNALPTGTKRLITFARSNHHILHDYERHEAIELTVDFLSGTPE